MRQQLLKILSIALSWEGLSPRLSVVAFKNNEPVGIVKNGIREIDGKKVAWNCGTGRFFPPIEN